jgi:uncharacterized protein DUF4398
VKRGWQGAFALSLAMLAGACALVPKANPRLDEARALHREAAADESLRRHAAPQMQRASEALERAVSAWNTLDDPAVVDHHAYLAKQRLAIAREVAQRAVAEAALADMRNGQAPLRNE